MEQVKQEVWNSKDRGLDAQSSIKSATNIYQGTGKSKEALALAKEFYKFIQSKRNKQINNEEIPE